MAGRPRTRARRAAGLPAQATPVDSDAPSPVHDRKREFAEGFERVWETARGSNYLAVRNGTRSPRVIERAAQDLVDWLHEVRPDLDAPRHVPVVSAWSFAEALALQFRWTLDQLDAWAAPEERESHFRRWATAENAAARHRADLGIGPVSEARLQQVRADAAASTYDLDALRQRGREVLEARAAT